jgi:plasmid stabilization system protein ParE
MAEVAWTEEAQRWLQDIHDFIAADNPDAAAATVRGIFDRTRALADFPEMGARHWASSRHVRVLLYGHYRIAYLVRDDGAIDILGVFHGALDISRYHL